MLTDESVRSLHQYGKNHELRFTDLTFDDSGMYQCIAENRHGVIYANAELRVFGELNSDWLTGSEVIQFEPQMQMFLH